MIPSLRTILLLGLVLRLLWALLVPIAPVSDSQVYDILAARLAQGQGYSWPDGQPTVYWAVGASALYAPVYALFGRSLLMLAALNIGMGVLLIAAIHALARTRFDDTTARLAALVAALWPSWIAFSSILSSELPSNLLCAAGMAIVMGRRALAVRILLGALLLVAATYVRPTVLPLLLAVPLLDGLMRRDWRAAAIGTALSLAVAAAALAPWAMRNQALFGRPVLVSANFGANLWMGNNPASNGGYMPLPPGLPENEAERDALLQREAIGHIRADLLRYARLSVNRAFISFRSETIAVEWNIRGLPPPVRTPLKVVMSLYWLAAFAAALAGFALFLWRAPLRLFDPLTAGTVLMGAVPVLVVGMDRYHFGLMPFVAIFAAHAVRCLATRRA